MLPFETDPSLSEACASGRRDGLKGMVVTHNLCHREKRALASDVAISIPNSWKFRYSIGARNYTNYCHSN